MPQRVPEQHVQHESTRSTTRTSGEVDRAQVDLAPEVVRERDPSQHRSHHPVREGVLRFMRVEVDAPADGGRELRGSLRPTDPVDGQARRVEDVAEASYKRWSWIVGRRHGEQERGRRALGREEEQ